MSKDRGRVRDKNRKDVERKERVVVRERKAPNHTWPDPKGSHLACAKDKPPTSSPSLRVVLAYHTVPPVVPPAFLQSRVVGDAEQPEFDTLFELPVVDVSELSEVTGYVVIFSAGSMYEAPSHSLRPRDLNWSNMSLQGSSGFSREVRLDSISESERNLVLDDPVESCDVVELSGFLERQH